MVIRNNIQVLSNLFHFKFFLFLKGWQSKQPGLSQMETRLQVKRNATHLYHLPFSWKMSFMKDITLLQGRAYNLFTEHWNGKLNSIHGRFTSLWAQIAHELTLFNKSQHGKQTSLTVSYFWRSPLNLKLFNLPPICWNISSSGLNSFTAYHICSFRIKLSLCTLLVLVHSKCNRSKQDIQDDC